jgi:hypothetical protein
VSTSNAAIKPKNLALNPRFPIKPTLGCRIHFVYCIGDLWLSKNKTPHGLRAARPVPRHSISPVTTSVIDPSLGQSIWIQR